MERDVPSALKATMERMGKDDTLVVSGSLTVIGEAEVFFKAAKKSK